MNRKALGRGLGALLSSDRTVDLGAEPSEIDLESIIPGPMQPRVNFDEAALANLAESIKTHGIVQPLLVRRSAEGFELIAGERRWRAAKMAGLTRVPVLVKDVADHDLLEIALIENIQREDLNPIEEAQAYKRLIENVGLTQEALATRVGRDRSYITNYLRLLRLPDDLQQLVKDGRLSTGHARTILGASEVDLQRRLARQVIEGGLSVRATEFLVQKASAERPARTARPSQAVDPNVRAAETKLRRALGTQVRILQAGNEGRGKVEISFFNTQDLDRIYDLLMRSATM
ncbi:MAG TPA: ParB/RepB/Spo0J family partition protein [Pyrinomonadaceae bacterium]|nr:ParB/RepB/Spo0J family partition protein [Pyrinomonadaceae bacterium]